MATTTQTPSAAGKPVEILPEEVSLRPIGRLERFLGQENYRIVKGLLTTPASVIGLVLLLFFIIIALAAPLLAPPIPGQDPYSIPRDGFGMIPRPMGSSWDLYPPPLPFWWKALTGTDQWVHILGTASGQYDIFYGIVWGTRVAFQTGLIIVAVALVIGLLMGSVAAYYGRWVDNVLMRIVDVFMTLPYIMAAMILSAVLIPRMGKSVLPVGVALVAFGWMNYSRLIRGDILSVRERDYVLAAKVLGVKDSRILLRHILPNAIFPTLVYASLDIGGIVLSYAALSFLGIGADIGYADWGQLLSFARNWITSLHTYWYIVVWPGVALTLFVLAWNLIGDAFRDVLDPRMRK
jgi:peptide/nickel transport system permease protein